MASDYQMAGPTALVRAPAKLTLSLRMTGRRHDGYHLLDAEMITLDLADELEIGPGDHLEVTGPLAVAAVPGDDTNLVRRALRLLGRTATVRLTKKVPTGGGLGGGSADAAAVLRWADCRDLELAARLGADVPFCLIGGRARVTGIGDLIEAMDFESISGQPYTLLTPPFGVSTAAVYRAYDELGSGSSGGPNDLEPAALAVEPSLAEWRQRLADATGIRPVLAGSGSTWFVPGAYPGGGRVVVRAALPPAPEWSIPSPA